MASPLYRQRDLAHNNLASAASLPVVGYVDPVELMDPDKLNLKIYDFLLRSIREDDRKNTKLLERYLQGSQDAWERIQARLFDLKTLWDASAIEDRLLIYLKNIVGWTKDLDYITDRMDYDQLRRLISVSVALWKAKGTEDAIEDVLRYVLQTRTRMITWFDYRWLLEEAYLTLDGVGTDTWALDDSEQYYSMMKIVDDGTLDRRLTRYLLSLLRSAGERIEVHYLKFMDLFDTDGNTSQWTAYDGSLESQSLIVSEGTAILDSFASEQFAFITSKQTFTWGDYQISAKIRANASTTGKYGLVLHAQDSWNARGAPVFGHEIYLDPANNALEFDGATSFAPWGNLYPDVWYTLSVRVEEVNLSTTRYRVYIDGELIKDAQKTTYHSGYIGFKHEANAVIEVDTLEVASVPTDAELIDINS